MSDGETWSDESDWEIAEDQLIEEAEEMAAPPPVLAVVGRPNVGKSTLVNRILGRREAVVQDLPGVTRDRVSYDALWSGRRFVVQDTGGWEPDAKGLQQLVADQAAVAMQTADAVVLVAVVAVSLELTPRRILYEDADLLAVDKPPGLVAHATVDPRRDHLVAAISRYLRARVVDYRFTSIWDEEGTGGRYWRTEELGLYLPTRSRGGRAAPRGRSRPR